MDPKPLLLKLGSIIRAILTFLFAFLVLGVMVWAYVAGFQLVTSSYDIISFGFYGLLLSLHVLVQSLFAFVEHRRMRARTKPCTFTKTIGFTISAYQEDPVYLRECLNSVKALKYPPELLRIVMVIDGNSEDDQYMMDMFKEVFAEYNPGLYVWRNNYHSWDPTQVEQDIEMAAVTGEDADYIMADDLQRYEVEQLIQTKRCVCIMQKWGGKREVMYTAFKALGSSVDYVQVCDSDTKLDPLATVELCKVLESDSRCGAVGGDVMILNMKDSYISFMSSLRYWMAFNIERACQSFFNCVSCISGPLGLYRNDVLQQFLESWYNQKFLGTHCTFGDDRHLTNRMLSMGYATKYTAQSRCYTETPAQFLRWLNQQTRWTKSYFRIFPFFVTATIIQLFWTGTLWDILWILCCIQLIGLVKATYACILRQNPVMVFMSLYSALYMTSLLPAKYFAILTMTKSSWGTSGRRKIVGNYMPLLPLSVWAAILLSGFGYTIYKESQIDWLTLAKLLETKFLIYGCVAYVCYWIIMMFLYWVLFRKVCKKRSQDYTLNV
uniref:Hyaluronan synthase 1 n=1 Tax=Oryzias sinensis TaxID=183150 RepID=A0A8C7YZX2_9TELE